MDHGISIQELLRDKSIGTHYPESGNFNRASIVLTENAVVEEAQRQSGLSDFGSDDFRERLRLRLDIERDNPKATEQTRQALFGSLVRTAAKRLQLEDIIRRHPEILDIEIDRPIIVVGSPRSGTTHLQGLLAADRRLRSLPVWEGSDPIPPSTETIRVDGVDPRYTRSVKQWEQIQQFAPNLPAMHSFAPDDVAEDHALHGLDFANYLLAWKPLPSWREYFVACTEAPPYEYQKRILKALQWYRGPNRWILKSAHHLEHIGPLLAAFPDATIALTHRDPIRIVRSMVTMMTDFMKTSSENVDIASVYDYWSIRIEYLIRVMVRDLHLIPERQRVDIYYHDFMNDELGAVRKIYQSSDLQLTDEEEQRMRKFLDNHRRNQYGRIRYNLEDFGINPEELRERFSFYYEKFPVVNE